MATAEDCRRHRISGATFYKWRSKCGRLGAPEARRLQMLEGETQRLKKLLAEEMLDNAMLKAMASRNEGLATSKVAPIWWTNIS